MISRTASELSLRSDTSGKRPAGERTAGDYNILSRHYVPTDFGPLTKLAFPYRLIGTLATMDVEKKQFGVLVKHGKYNPEKLVRAVHDYYATKDDEIEVSDEDKEKDKKEAKKVKDKAKKEKDEAKDEKDEAVKFNTKRCQPVKQDEIIAGHIYAAYIQELKKFARLRVAEINRISARSSANQLTVHLLDYGMITTILEGELIKLDDFFTEGAYKTALALACQLPTGRAPFPRLENFELGDHVEVYVLSDEEPCLAVFGSLAPTQKSISRDLLFHGVNPKYVDILQRAMNGKIPAEPQKRKGWALNDSMLFSSWNVVSILSCEDPTNIAVRDTSTSLRFLRLQDNINRAYKKADFRKAMEIDAAELYSGTPVVVYFPPCNTLLRGTVTSVHPNGCDVEALDIPDFTVYNAPINHVFYPPSLLLNVPPQIFYFNLMKGCETTIESCDLLKERLDRNSVGTLRVSLETGCAQLVAGKKIDITKIFQEYLSTLIVEDSEKSDGDADVEGSDMGGEVGEAQDGEAQDDDDGRSNVSFTD